MNNTDPNWKSQFSQGFSSPGDSGSYLPWLLGILAFLALAWFLYDQYVKYQAKLPPPTKAKKPVSAVTVSKQNLTRYIPVPGRINPLQQKVIYELIDEFRKQETSAQSIPSAVLEKYSEFFFNNVRKLKTNDNEVRDYVDMNFPVKEGYSVEMDFHTQGSLHLIKSKVVEVSAKTLLIAYNGQVPAFMKKGAPLLLNYNVGKHFLQGSTSIADIRHQEGILVRRPAQVVLSSERRFARVVLKRGTGVLQDTKTGYKANVRVLDLSLEGVRVQVERPLDKSHIHQLIFDSEADGKIWSFGPIECAPSKAFLTGTGAYESGLVFLYLDLGAKSKLLNFMKQLAQELAESNKTP